MLSSNKCAAIKGALDDARRIVELLEAADVSARSGVSEKAVDSIVRTAVARWDDVLSILKIAGV